MARYTVLAICLLAAAYTVDAQQASNVSPLVEYFSTTNTSTYSYFWTALQAAHLDDYLNDSTLTLTIFAPTNDAWLKRMPTLTRANGITVQQLFSESKSAALQNMLQYHILQQPRTVASFGNNDYLSTLANLCSDAKTLQIVKNGTNVTLYAAGGSHPNLLDRGIVVGSQAKSIVYALDDVLLPAVVSVPLSAALANFNATGESVFSPTIAQKENVLDQLQSQTADEPLAPVYLAPQTSPSGAPTVSALARAPPPKAAPSPPVSTSDASGAGVQASG